MPDQGLPAGMISSRSVFRDMAAESGDSIPIKDKRAVSSFVVSFWVN